MKKYVIFFLLITSFYSTYAQWESLENINSSYIFRDIEFLNNDTGFICGDTIQPQNGGTDQIGIISKTTDGGLNWDNSFFPYNIMCLYFLNCDTGFAGSAAGRIYRTYNGGLSWDTVLVMSPPEPISYGFWSIHFVDQQHGFASNFSGSGMMKTSDGGNNWEYVYNSQGQKIGGGHLMFSSDSIAYCGAKWKTTDGGVDWFDISNTPFLPQIYHCDYFQLEPYFNYYDNDLGFVLGCYYDLSQPCGYTSDLGKTINGGLDWELSIYPDMIALNTIEFINKNIIYMAGGHSCYPLNGSVGDYPCFLKSIDGGQKWYYQKSNYDTLVKVFKLDFPTSEIGYALGGNSENDTARSIIFKTTNGGGPLYDALIPYEPEAISEESDLNLLNVFPNPASTLLNIEFSEQSAGIKTLEVYKLSGQKVLSRRVENSSTYTLDVSKLPQGNYLLKLLSKNEVFVRKFVIIR